MKEQLTPGLSRSGTQTESSMIPGNPLRGEQRCPACGSVLPWDLVTFGRTFECLTCKSALHIPNRYGRRILQASFAVPAIFAYVNGFSLVGSLLLVGVGFFPTMVVVSFALFRGSALQITRVWEPDRGILGNRPLQE